MKILLLEDDTNLGFILREHLQLNGFEATLCVNGEDGINCFKKNRFDLCLVDIMMPKKDGFTFAREVREKDKDIPLIFLTAKSLKEDKIKGFKSGCDDYITKPFSIEELLLRINAVLRRTRGNRPEEDTQTQFEIGAFSFDYDHHLLSGKKVKYKLTPKEAQLLRLLCLYKNKTLERDTALREIWEEESYFAGRSMDVFISKLRKYLKEDESVQIISIHGKGFKLVMN